MNVSFRNYWSDIRRKIREFEVFIYLIIVFVNEGIGCNVEGLRLCLTHHQAASIATGQVGPPSKQTNRASQVPSWRNLTQFVALWVESSVGRLIISFAEIPGWLCTRLVEAPY